MQRKFFLFPYWIHASILIWRNPLDPPQVTEFRDQYVQIMQGWINAELENTGADADMPNQL